jgi:acyl-coenzyme A thioesterase PaaI-like protein
MTESVFLREDEHFMPTGHARGPWDAGALHGGAPAALMTAAFERMAPGSELQIARLAFEFVRPIPFAPLTLLTHVVRAGRRVGELAGELRAGEEEVVCRASALCVRAVPTDLPMPGPTAQMQPTAAPEAQLPPPESGTAVRFALDRSSADSFAGSAMEMRWLSDPRALGPGRVWMRLRHPLLPGEPLTPLARLAATADFGNGVSAALPFDRFLFINADLTIHLHRPPLGEWIGIGAQTLLHPGGPGVAESVLHDAHGSVARAFQTLIVQSR